MKLGEKHEYLLLVLLPKRITGYQKTSICLYGSLWTLPPFFVIVLENIWFFSGLPVTQRNPRKGSMVRTKLKQNAPVSCNGYSGFGFHFSRPVIVYLQFKTTFWLVYIVQDLAIFFTYSFPHNAFLVDCNLTILFEGTQDSWLGLSKKLSVIHSYNFQDSA